MQYRMSIFLFRLIEKAAVLLLVCCLFACKDRYDVILPPSQVSLLVVEGTILTNSQTIIKLSRTSELDERNIHFEDGASVVIEASDNSYYPLFDIDSGRYVSSFSGLNENVQYRVRIKTKDNREYLSEFSSPVKTPAIDSLPWQFYNGGVEIYVDSRDRENNVQYYRWEYDETWEFHSPYQQFAEIYYENSPGLRAHVGYYDSIGFGYNQARRKCWQSRNSSAILLGSSAKLSADRVYQPLRYFENHAWELSYLYSIKVKQYGLSKEGYDFFAKIKKNTESLGTIFDPQPSEITGNFRCLTDTAEKVVGHVEPSRVVEKRMYISIDELPPNWNLLMECEVKGVDNISDSLIKYFRAGELLPGEPVVDRSGWIVQVMGYLPVCIDCTLRGTNVRPSFWPN